MLITNASMFHREHVVRGLATLDANQGEIWAKLETGTEDYYRLIERTPIPFRQILDNITAAARVRPLVIQSLFMRVEGRSPPPAELVAFCDRLGEIVGRRRANQAGADLHGRPPAGRKLCRAADRRRSRRHRRTVRDARPCRLPCSYGSSLTSDS